MVVRRSESTRDTCFGRQKKDLWDYRRNQITPSMIQDSTMGIFNIGGVV